MALNLAKAATIYNEGTGTSSLSKEELQLLVDGDLASTAFSFSDSIVLLIDLGRRYRLDNLLYYVSPAASEQVKVYGRQCPDSSYPWQELAISFSSDHYLVSFDSISSKYWQLKLEHVVSSGSASIKELELYSSERDIKYGDEGQDTLVSVASDMGERAPESVEIFNSSDEDKDIFILLDGKSKDSSGLSLSYTLSGTYVPLHGEGIFIDDTFSWSSGMFSGTEEDSGNLILSSGVDNGSYYSPVIEVPGRGYRFFWEATISGNSQVDSLPDSSTPTADIRYSAVSPSDPGWSSGQLSEDSLWSPSSGTLSFYKAYNEQVLDFQIKNYFQFKLSLERDALADSPVVTKAGLEEAFVLAVSSGNFNTIYVKSSLSEKDNNREAALISWSYESRNKEQ